MHQVLLQLHAVALLLLSVPIQNVAVSACFANDRVGTCSSDIHSITNWRTNEIFHSVQVEDYVVGVTATSGQKSGEQSTQSSLPARQLAPDSLI